MKYQNIDQHSFNQIPEHITFNHIQEYIAIFNHILEYRAKFNQIPEHILIFNLILEHKAIFIQSDPGT